MKKQRILQFLAACVLVTALAACGGVDYGNATEESPAMPSEAFYSGRYEFVRSYEALPEACRTRLSVTEHNGKNALLVDTSLGGVPYLAIDAASLLGGSISSLRTMELDIEVITGGGEFYAVSGSLTPLIGDELYRGGSAPWSVYLETKNPNTARIMLTDPSDYMTYGLYGIFLLAMDVDNAVTAGQPPTSFYILDIRFYDKHGNELMADYGAGFNAPEGFGEIDRGGLFVLASEVAIDGAAGTSEGGWGQAVTITTANGGGEFDASTLTEDTVITVYSSASETSPELILQSWSGGEGWAKVAPTRQNSNGTVLQFHYDDLVAAFNSDDFGGLLDQLFVGDTGAPLEVFSVTVGVL